jgi:xylulose-5-phosphate/fructose-6-phosphate phosphoketolase
LHRVDAYWRAANYLSIGQIYLLDNPLLREPLRPEHIKPRLLGHWGTSPGLNFIYVHLNRIIKSRDLNVISICGPGHGGPAMVANTYLEGTYSEIYPEVTQDVAGMRRLFRLMLDDPALMTKIGLRMSHQAATYSGKLSGSRSGFAESVSA